MKRLRERFAKHSGGNRQFVEVLSIIALYGFEAVSNACADALEEHMVISGSSPRLVGDPIISGVSAV